MTRTYWANTAAGHGDRIARQDGRYCKENLQSIFALPERGHGQAKPPNERKLFPPTGSPCESSHQEINVALFIGIRFVARRSMSNVLGVRVRKSCDRAPLGEEGSLSLRYYPND